VFRFVNMEYYPDRLKREVDEIKRDHPEVEKIIEAVLSEYRRSSADFDYEIERTHAMYKKVADILVAETPPA